MRAAAARGAVDLRPTIRSESELMTSEEVLRRLTIGDPSSFQMIARAATAGSAPSLDARSVALLRMAASVATGSVGQVWRQRVGDALDAGVTFDEIVAALVALVPTIGTERIAAVAPDIAWALGYDVDAALERLDEVAPVVVR